MPSNELILPFVIAVDDRETLPYYFKEIKSDKVDKQKIFIARTERKRLKTGDYSIVGYEDRISIERKSWSDLYGTLGQRREQFRQEIQRLSYLNYAAVVVETDFLTACTKAPEHSKLLPKVVYRTCLSWQMSSHVPWIFCNDRRFAEITTFRILFRCWQKLQTKEPFINDH